MLTEAGETFEQKAAEIEKFEKDLEAFRSKSSEQVKNSMKNTYISSLGDFPDMNYLIIELIVIGNTLTTSLVRVPTEQGKQRKWTQKNPCQGKTQGIWKFCQKTGNFVCSSCKFHDSKGKEYCDICRKNFNFFPGSWIGLPSQFRLCNSHK